MLIKQLKLIQSAAARVLTKTSKVDHITPVLRYLHRETFMFAIELLPCYKPSGALRSGTGLLTVPRVQTEHREAAHTVFRPTYLKQTPSKLKGLQLSVLWNEGGRLLCLPLPFNKLNLGLYIHILHCIVITYSLVLFQHILIFYVVHVVL